MPDTISNSSCLIALDNIGRLDILKKLYGKLLITEEVAKEVGEPLPDFLIITSVKNINYTRLLMPLIDKGEASTLALGLEHEKAVLILDDLKARKVANQLSLRYTGLLGVLLKARKKGVINSVRTIIDELKQANFRIADSVEQEVLRLAGEV